MFSSYSKKFDVRILQFKPKLNQKDRFIDVPIGFEYNTEILTDTELIRKVLESNSYFPKKEFIIDYNYEISKILVTINIFIFMIDLIYTKLFIYFKNILGIPDSS